MSRNTSEREQSSPNFLARKAATAAVLTGIGISALAGCTPSQAEGHEPAPSSSAPESSAPVETQKSADKTPDLIKSYDKLSWTDFDGKDQTGRVQYIDYKLETNKDEHESLLASRNRPAYVELTKDSSPQDIFNHFTYVNDEANFQQRVDAATGKKLHDADSGIKYMSGSDFSVSNDPNVFVSNSFKERKQKHLDSATDAPYVNSTILTATGSSGIKEGELHGVKQTYQDIQGFTNKGEDATSRWIYVEYPDLVTGDTEGTWLLDEFIAK